jgi:cardiolipin synthase
MVEEAEQLVEEIVEEVEEGLDRILTIPNVITAVRLSLMPVFVYLLFGQDERFWAGWLLFAIGSTDWLDGFLARRLGQVSTVGKVLDPVADRLLFFVGGIAILIDGSVPTWLVVLVLVREVLVAAGTLALAGMGARRIDVTWYGKAATFLLMGAFPAFLVSHSDTGAADAYGVLAWSVAIPGLALSYFSALLYIPKGRVALAEGRADRSRATP